MPVTQNTLKLAGVNPFEQQMTGLTKRREALDVRSTELAGQQQDTQEQQGMLVSARGDESAPVRAEMTKKLKDAPSTELNQERIGNFERPTMDPQEMQQSFAMLMASAMLAGVASRQPYYAAMAGMTGAMDGFMKADAAHVKESLAIFDKNVTAIKERNTAKKQEVEAAWKKHQNDLGALKSELELISAKYDDPMALMAARSKSITEAQKLIDTNIRSVDSTMERLTRDYTNAQVRLAQMEQTAELRKQTIELQKARMAQQAGAGESTLTDAGMAVAEELLRAGKPLPKTRRGMRDDEMLNAMGAHQEGGAGSGSIVGGQADYKANQAAYTQITKDLASIRPYKVMLDTNVDIAKDLAKKIVKTDSQLANKPINWLQTHLSDSADVGEYLAQIQIVSTEAARVLNNPRLVGQLTDSARHEMQEVVNGNMPLNMTARILDRLKSDGSNRVNAMTTEADDLRRKLGSRRAGDPQPAAAPAAPAAPAHATGGGDLRSKAEAGFGAYEPDKYDYRVNPSGSIQRKAK